MTRASINIPCTLAGGALIQDALIALSPRQRLILAGLMLVNNFFRQPFHVIDGEQDSRPSIESFRNADYNGKMDATSLQAFETLLEHPHNPSGWDALTRLTGQNVTPDEVRETISRREGMDDEFLEKFQDLAYALEPELLYCDGERDLAEAKLDERRLINEWNALEAALGCPVTEDHIRRLATAAGKASREAVRLFKRAHGTPNGHHHAL